MRALVIGHLVGTTRILLCRTFYFSGASVNIRPPLTIVESSGLAPLSPLPQEPAPLTALAPVTTPAGANSAHWSGSSAHSRGSQLRSLVWLQCPVPQESAPLTGLAPVSAPAGVSSAHYRADETPAAARPVRAVSALIDPPPGPAGSDVWPTVNPVPRFSPGVIECNAMCNRVEARLLAFRPGLSKVCSPL